ncbi:hypothetical protein EGW08_010388 [Elysia chlorotica]|uniref:Tartrate-resistant acid phosphatase type 5 n=1 Tax=Elysia chlorotica TaxID=188477 RepID=A0A433TK35_ELYCH|nr:hypothetical protein EGW08_010388 [Elysia chlorotica]
MESLRLLILGDMGGIDHYPYNTFFERSTAFEMGRIADLYKPDAIFALGDNFYYDGVKDVHDSRFAATFEDVYYQASLQIPWYLIAGNHDHNGNVSAQIAYSNYSLRWHFPDNFYYREFRISSASNETVGIVFIDTVLLCGNTKLDDDVGQPQHDGKESKDKYWDTVKDYLKHSKANYLFTAGHFPIYSVGAHGPTECLTKDLQPMLETFEANGHFCGHDHNLQHLMVHTNQGQRIDYFVSGMANFVNPSTKHKGDVPDGSLQFHNANYFTKGGFLYAEATPQNMTFTFIAASGQVLYTTVLEPRL